MTNDAVSRLTERQKQCLRFLHAHLKPGQIATELDVSTDRVNQLLKSAREKLGVSRSIDAAILLATAEGNPSHVLGAQDVGVPSGQPIGDQEGSFGEETVRKAMAALAEAHAPFERERTAEAPLLWPIPTSARPFNGLTWYQKLGWGVAIALGVTVLAGAMVSLQNAIH